MVVGSDNIIEYIQKKLNIKDGETTEDGLFTLKLVECLGACGYGPVMKLEDHYQEHLTPERIDEIVEKLKNQA